MYNKLESLRGLAAICVVLFHSPFNVGSDPLGFFQNSYLFVDFFFVLSGFVMSHAYEAKINSGLPFSSYLLLRLGRLYPLHLITLLACLIWVMAKTLLYHFGLGSTNPLINNDLPTFISNLLLIHSLGIHDHLAWNQPSWSISTEFAAYILFFALTRLVDKKHTLIFPMSISVLCYLVLFTQSPQSFDRTYDLGLVRCLGAFYAGVALYRLKNGISIPPSWFPMAELPLILLLISAIWVADQHQYVILASLFLMGFSLLVFSTEPSGAIGSLLENRYARSLGRWSYSIYMIHLLVLEIATGIMRWGLRIDPEQAFGAWAIVLNILLLGVIIALAQWAYRHIEHPANQWVRRRLSGSNPGDPGKPPMVSLLSKDTPSL